MGDAVDARGENAAGLAEGFEFKAGCWGEEELDPRAFLALVAVCMLNSSVSKKK